MTPISQADLQGLNVKQLHDLELWLGPQSVAFDRFELDV